MDPFKLEYHPNDDERTWGNPPCIAMGDVVVCTFPVYSSDDKEMPDSKRHMLARLFAHSPRLMLAVKNHLASLARYNLDELFGHDEAFFATMEALGQVLNDINQEK